MAWSGRVILNMRLAEIESDGSWRWIKELLDDLPRIRAGKGDEFRKKAGKDTPTHYENMFRMFFDEIPGPIGGTEMDKAVQAVKYVDYYWHLWDAVYPDAGPKTRDWYQTKLIKQEISNGRTEVLHQV